MPRGSGSPVAARRQLECRRSDTFPVAQATAGRPGMRPDRTGSGARAVRPRLLAERLLAKGTLDLDVARSCDLALGVRVPQEHVSLGVPGRFVLVRARLHDRLVLG